MGGGNDNSRLLAAAAVPIVGQERPRRQRGPEGRGGGPKTRLAELRSHPAQIRFANRAFEGGLNDHLQHLTYMRFQKGGQSSHYTAHRGTGDAADIRELYVQVRRTVQVLSATLELEGLE